jgi:hypothetical protein
MKKKVQLEERKTGEGKKYGKKDKVERNGEYKNKGGGHKWE